MDVLVNPLQIILQNHTSWQHHFSRPDDSRERPSKQLDRKDGNLCYYFCEQTIFHCISERNKMKSMTTFSLILFIFLINFLLFVFDGQSYQKKNSLIFVGRCGINRFKSLSHLISIDSNRISLSKPWTSIRLHWEGFFPVKTKT